MGKFAVSDAKEQSLVALMESLGLKDEEIEEKFIRGSGNGGQKINKTSSCVYLKHIPSNLEIKCQRTRSQALNRYHARVELCEKVMEQKRDVRSKKLREISKIRRQKSTRARKSKEKILADKQKHAKVKSNRKKVTSSD